MKIIYSTNRKGVTKEILVDDEDYDLLNSKKWYIHKSKNDRTCYAIASICNNGKCYSIKMHRLILKLTDPKIKIDHKNNNGLDNQKHNLRTATNSQNGANRRSAINSTSKYLGVHHRKADKKAYLNKNGSTTFHNRSEKWIAEITINGRTKYLGCFNSEIEASECYNKAALKYHGEFFNINNLI